MNVWIGKKINIILPGKIFALYFLLSMFQKQLFHIFSEYCSFTLFWLNYINLINWWCAHSCNKYLLCPLFILTVLSARTLMCGQLSKGNNILLGISITVNFSHKADVSEVCCSTTIICTFLLRYKYFFVK